MAIRHEGAVVHWLRWCLVTRTASSLSLVLDLSQTWQEAWPRLGAPGGTVLLVPLPTAISPGWLRRVVPSRP